ncbi:hypothetical protein B0G81_5949 [Paraburkholderia sp. BL6665CI2N2]|nr:hypothetical protein B0G81_5949 [Paraburkholderia sp. BL6665CI2N2]
MTYAKEAGLGKNGGGLQPVHCWKAEIHGDAMPATTRLSVKTSANILYYQKGTYP